MLQSPEELGRRECFQLLCNGNFEQFFQVFISSVPPLGNKQVLHGKEYGWKVKKKNNKKLK